jgi:phosphatidylserine/phosphatidylglycerophosphate/cardiolipin synthase-like enzyme
MYVMARNVARSIRFAVMSLALAGISAGPASAPPRITVRFSPKGGCAALVAWHIDRAAAAVYIESYQWSSAPIHDAVLRACARGVPVFIILDRGLESSKTSLLPDLLAHGFLSAGGPDDTLRIDDRHAIHHNKVTLRDPEIPALAAHENGSFNYSKSAEISNAENAQVVEGFPAVTAEYLANWRVHWGHSRGVRPPKGRVTSD